MEEQKSSFNPVSLILIIAIIGFIFWGVSEAMNSTNISENFLIKYGRKKKKYNLYPDLIYPSPSKYNCKSNKNDMNKMLYTYNENCNNDYELSPLGLMNKYKELKSEMGDKYEELKSKMDSIIDIVSN